MRKSFMATGVALAVALSGCSQESSHSEDYSVDSPPQTTLQKDVDQIVGSKVLEKEGFDFSGVDPEELRVLGHATIRGVGSITIATLATTEGSTDQEKGKLYANTQNMVVKFAKNLKWIDMSTFDSTTGKYDKSVRANIAVANYDSTLVLTNEGDFKTGVANNSPDAGAAVTIRPQEFKQLNQAVSFVQPNKQEFISEGGVAVEACQARMNVTTKDENYRILAQEMICNSLGTAYLSAVWGVPYIDYVKYEDGNKISTMASNDGKSVMSQFIVSKLAYKQLASHQSPSSTQGWRLVHNQ